LAILTATLNHLQFGKVSHAPKLAIPLVKSKLYFFTPSQVVFECKQTRDPGVAWSRIVGRLRAHGNLRERVRKRTMLPMKASRNPTIATEAIQRTIAPGLV